MRGMAASRNYSVDSGSLGIWRRMKPQPVQTKPSAENPPPRITRELSSRRTIPLGSVSHSVLLQKGQATAVGIAPLSPRDKPNGLRSAERLRESGEHGQVGVKLNPSEATGAERGQVTFQMLSPAPLRHFGGASLCRDPARRLKPTPGFEPGTPSLRVKCSTS